MTQKLKRHIRNLDQMRNLLTFLHAMEIPEDGLEVSVCDYEHTRTLEQNKFMWRAAYQPIAEQIGEATGTMLTKDDIHDFMRDKFAPRVIRKIPGSNETKSYPKSTTKFKRQEMSDYLEQVFAWGASNGVWFA